MSYRSARNVAFLRELSDDFYGSQISHKGTFYKVVGSSQAESKAMDKNNYTALKPAVFDMPATTQVLSDSTTALGFDVSGIGLRSNVQQDGTEFEVYQIQDDPREPFVRLICTRKQ